MRERWGRTEGKVRMSPVWVELNRMRVKMLASTLKS